jgi:hypothetical protein
MEGKAWTARGKMLDVDRVVIQAVVDKNLAAARIFVTGEVAESYIGDGATRLLVNINDTLHENGAHTEPLFVQTRADTVRMTRFDPDFVWRCFDPDILTGLVQDETNRLGVKMDPWAMEEFDFYRSMLVALKKDKGDYIFPVVKKGGDLDSFYNAMYLACLLLLEKPGYMDVPAAVHFADPVAAEHLKWMEYRQLSPEEREEVVRLRDMYARITTLTNAELNFVVGLFERDRL